MPKIIKKTDVKKALYDTVIECSVTKVYGNNLVNASVSEDIENRWESATLENIKPLLNFSLDPITEGEEIIALSVNSDEEDLYYIRKDIDLPLLKENGIVFGKNNIIQALLSYLL